MADMDGILANKDKDYGVGVPVETNNYFLKGLSGADWGVRDRMSRIFRPSTGKTVIWAQHLVLRDSI